MGKEGEQGKSENLFKKDFIPMASANVNRFLNEITENNCRFP